MIEKMKELKFDDAFAARVRSVASVEEYQQLLKEYGVEVSVEELQADMDEIPPFVNEDGELTPEAMDAIAGGCWGLQKSQDMYNSGVDDYFSGKKDNWKYFWHSCYRQGYNVAKDLAGLRK